MKIDRLNVGIEVKKCYECEYKRNSREWISAETLPPDDRDVLVYFEYFRYGDYNRLFRTIGIGSTFRGEWSCFINCSSGWDKWKIIAWQPLPEPPELCEVMKGDKNE